MLSKVDERLRVEKKIWMLVTELNQLKFLLNSFLQSFAHGEELAY
jgi:hypothetical protein